MNVQKYVESLNNLIGVDYAYMKGDKDVDNLAHCIVMTKKLEDLLEELREYKEMIDSDKELILKGHVPSLVYMLSNLSTDIEQIIKKYEERV